MPRLHVLAPRRQGPRLAFSLGARVTESRVSVAGDVAVKILKVTDPTPEQFQAFRNEVAVLR